MPWAARLATAAVAGIAAGLSFEPAGLAILLPLAVAALAVACHRSGLGRGFAAGAVFGAAFLLTLLPWLRVIGVDAWIGLSLFEALFYGLLGFATAAVTRLPLWPVWLAACWVGVEALRSAVPFGGFPWGRLAFATVDTPVAGLVRYAGGAGVTFAVALAGALLAWGFVELRRRGGYRRPVAAAAGAALVWFAGAAVSPDPVPSPSPRAAAGDDASTATVAAVQGDVPGEGMDAFDERRAVLDNHVEATTELARSVAAGEAPRPDLVIWPENSTDIDPFEDASAYADIQGAVDAVGAPTLVGAMVAGERPEDVLNQGIVWAPGTGPGERYSKNHPVPFGEYIPFRDEIAPYVSRLDQIPRDMVAGTRPGLLPLGPVTVGDVICFEVAYDDLVHEVVEGGADLVVVQTNNATYMGTGQIEQQFAISRLRAVETNRYVVVAATNGLTGIVAPDGRVVAQAPTRTREVLVETVSNPGGLTPAVRFGGLVELLVSLLAAAAVCVGLVVGRRARRRAPSAAPPKSVTTAIGGDGAG
jgi:apolipoprotein N-acyltransferase